MMTNNNKKLETNENGSKKKENKKPEIDENGSKAYWGVLKTLDPTKNRVSSGSYSCKIGNLKPHLESACATEQICLFEICFSQGGGGWVDHERAKAPTSSSRLIKEKEYFPNQCRFRYVLNPFSSISSSFSLNHCFR